jgi:hypothetical protein
MRSNQTQPLVIPVEILGLKGSKLPEKLLLAMCVADPAPTRVCRALGMTSAGVRKLTQRLVAKGLLTVAGDRYVVHLPGLVNIEHQTSGQSVSHSSTTQNKKKVTRRESKVAQVDIEPLVVPAELVAFKYLMASEKLLLAYYLAHPAAQTKTILMNLRLSRAGLKKLRGRLIANCVLIRTSIGFSIRLPGLLVVQGPDGGHFVPESEALKNGYKVACAAPKLTPARDVYIRWRKCLKLLLRQPSTTPSDLLSSTSARIKQAEEECREGLERDAVLAEMKKHEDHYVVEDFVYNNIPRKHEAKCLALIRSATPAQLLLFREKVGAMMQAGLPEPKLLEMVTKTISQ